MSRRARRGGLAGAGLLGAVLLWAVGAGPASAAPQLQLSPPGGPPGTEFTITGTGFAAAEVVLRWGSQTGDELARTTGPDFTVVATVPDDAESNSYPVVAVVTEGGSTSTSSTSFQVDAGEAPETTTTIPTTTSTVADTPAATTPDTTPTTGSSTRAPASSDGGLSRASSLTGGIDGGLADTTNGSDLPAGGLGGAGGGAPAAGGAGAGAAGAGTATTGPPAAGNVGAPADAAASSTVPAGAGSVGAAGAGVQGPVGPRGATGESDSALGPKRTSQSAGAVRNPVLLVVGLGMVFAAGVILAVRNRHRHLADVPEG